LGVASEATFSLAEQLETVEFRFRSLTAIEEKLSSFHGQAKDFVLKKLQPAWNSVVHFVREGASKFGIKSDELISKADRCLSPSDFGFHNCLRTREGSLRFYDFEYAGWDDPAKMVSDFYHQPRFRISKELIETFINEVVPASHNPEFLLRKIGLLRPVFGIKWSCIMLNDFVPLGDRKRKFSVGDEKWEERLKQRLKNAEEQLKRVEINNLSS
jgi:hypothetical protein